MDGWDGMGGKGMLGNIHHRKVKNGGIFTIGKGKLGNFTTVRAMLGNINHRKGNVVEYSP